MTKKEIRFQFRQKRTELELERVTFLQSQLEEQFYQMDHLSFLIVHSYLPMLNYNEPDPRPLIRHLQQIKRDLQWCVPVSDPNEFTMQHVKVESETKFTTNAWGIKEPLEGERIEAAKIDAAFIPLLAFDMNGHRVGFGKGFYDRFIAEARPDMLKIGLSFFSPIDAIDDIDFFDKKLDFCITPDKVYAF